MKAIDKTIQSQNTSLNYAKPIQMTQSKKSAKELNRHFQRLYTDLSYQTHEKRSSLIIGEMQ